MHAILMRGIAIECDRIRELILLDCLVGIMVVVKWRRIFVSVSVEVRALDCCERTVPFVGNSFYLLLAINFAGSSASCEVGVASF